MLDNRGVRFVVILVVMLFIAALITMAVTAATENPGLSIAMVCGGVMVIMAWVLSF